MVGIFSMLLQLEIYFHGKFQKLSLYQLDFFFANTVMYIWKKLPHQIKDSNSVKKIEIELLQK